MAIGFTFPPDVEDARRRIREFVGGDIRPTDLVAVSVEAAKTRFGSYVLKFPCPR